MLWFTVWTLLVLGTLTGAFFLGRDLYRKGRRLLRELDRASQVLAEAAARAEGRELPLTTPAPVDLTDPEPARARRALAAQATAGRQAARQARHEAAYARWRSFSH
ncbi:MAG: hypothetical protein H5T83_00465 [Actinotalea sp.]|nr:hypothetical protein [Actinotalea sp.]